MPIKIPKGFQRRKSSGNVLDEVQTPDASFKVFARPNSEHTNLDINLARQRPLPGPRNSYEEEDEDLFTVMRPDAANRGGTANSLSTAPYDSGASSTRLSSSSTVPSSLDAKSDKNVYPVVSTNQTDGPIPPPHQSKSNGFLRNAGRTFSFGVKSKPSDPVEPPPVPPLPPAKGRFSFSQGRERAMTASSVSTATPPRLLESDLTLETNGLDGFGSMFDGIGAKSTDPSPVRMVAAETRPAVNSKQLRPDIAQASRSAPPHPITVDLATQIEASPYSWTSENSRDGLMQTPSSINTVVHNSPKTIPNRAFGQPATETVLPQRRSGSEDNLFSDSPSRPRAYSRNTRSNAPPPSSFPAVSRPNTSVHLATTTSGQPLQTSPILEKDDSTLDDPSLLASAQLASQYQDVEHSAPIPSNKKVMTPAQFERYRQQKDETHRMNKVFKNTKPESDDSDNDYDDAEEEDEIERDRQAARQRRKQEAHLAVYRQTMMKVTGEGKALNVRPDRSPVLPPDASQSTTDLANQFSAINFDKSPARSSDDEDDDVPLGILAAHGFPNKNKPPNRLASSQSNPNMRALAQQQAGPGSVAGESVKRGSLPVFARHLPEDPYFGAGIVNQPTREPLAMHSSNLMPSGAATAHPHHPAGLVGVIAGEERARAMRRGSPNAAVGTFDLPPSMPGYPNMGRAQNTGSMPNLLMPGMSGMPMMPGMPGMPGMPTMPMMPNMLSASDQAQLQMSQQMTQMMQMQMQWMQQMQQFMAPQGGNNVMPNMGPMPPTMPNTQMGMNTPRPQSVPLQHQGVQEQRTMSLLSPPSTGGWNNSLLPFPNRAGSTYAPSIAPSERSNVGLASRYRPVSTAQEAEPSWDKRASTMTSTTFRPWSQVSSGPKPARSTVRKVVNAADDEDDEQGWAEMKAKKDQKKKTWKLRKGQNVLQELYNGAT